MNKLIFVKLHHVESNESSRLTPFYSDLKQNSHNINSGYNFLPPICIGGAVLLGGRDGVVRES